MEKVELAQRPEARDAPNMKKGRGKDGESGWKSGGGTSTALYLADGARAAAVPERRALEGPRSR
jgi:hypothetical protein